MIFFLQFDIVVQKCFFFFFPDFFADRSRRIRFYSVYNHSFFSRRRSYTSSVSLALPPRFTALLLCPFLFILSLLSLSLSFSSYFLLFLRSLRGSFFVSRRAIFFSFSIQPPTFQPPSTSGSTPSMTTLLKQNSLVLFRPLPAA